MCWNLLCWWVSGLLGCGEGGGASPWGFVPADHQGCPDRAGSGDCHNCGDLVGAPLVQLPPWAGEPKQPCPVMCSPCPGSCPQGPTQSYPLVCCWVLSLQGAPLLGWLCFRGSQIVGLGLPRKSSSSLALGMPAE